METIPNITYYSLFENYQFWNTALSLRGQWVEYHFSQVLFCYGISSFLASQMNKFIYYIMTSSNGKNFHVTSPLWGESTGQRWIPLKKASDAELWCFL